MLTSTVLRQAVSAARVPAQALHHYVVLYEHGVEAISADPEAGAVVLERLPPEGLVHASCHRM